MAGEDKHTISLVIEAKNLSSEKLEAVARDIDGLGDHAIKTENALNNLKLDQANLDSFTAMSAELSRLQDELAEAEAAFKKNAAAIKKNSNAGDAEHKQLEKQKLQLRQQRKELSSVSSEYEKLRKKVAAKQRADESLVEYQERLAKKTRDVGKESARLNAVYDKQVAKTREKIAARRAEVAAENELIASADRIIAARKRQIESDEKQAVASEKLQGKLVEYQMILARLNVERNKGVISAEQYMQAEVDLRERLELTSGAVRDRKRVTEAEAAATKKAAQEKIQAAQAEIAAMEQQEAAIRQNIDLRNRLKLSTKEQAAAERVAAAASATAVDRYRDALVDLIDQKRKNEITNTQFIRAEKTLRKQLKLTKDQVHATQKALELDALSKDKAKRSTDALTKVTRRLAQAYTVLLAAQQSFRAVTSGVESYGQLEKAMIGVEKTTGAVRSEIESLTEQLVTLSTDVTPTTAVELANMAQVAGQLGVKGSADLTKLVSTVDALENSTNLAGEEAATLLTRILTLTKEGVGNIDRLGSVVVDLGNNFAVAEDEIVHMTKEIVTGTSAIDLGAASAAAFGAALKVSGQQAERSRSAMFRLSQSIKEAVLRGGEDLERLSDLTGMTADQLEKNLGERPQDVLFATIQGFAKVREEGGLLTDTLSDMGIEGVESTSVLEALAKNVDVLGDMLASTEAQWVNNNALMDEALKAYASQEGAIGRLANQFEHLKVKIGQALSDETDKLIKDLTVAINDGDDAVVGLVEDIVKFGEGIQEVLVDLGTFTDDLVGIGSVWDLVYGSLRSGLNVITYLVKGLILGLQEWVLTLKQIGWASDESIKHTEQAIHRLKESMTGDLNDIRDASDDMFGRSSDAYRDFDDALKNHGHLLDGVDEKTRNHIKTLSTYSEGIRELDDQRRDATRILTELSRQEEMRLKMLKQATEAEAAAAVEAGVSVEAMQRLAKSTDLATTSQENLSVELSRLHAQFLRDTSENAFESYQQSVNALISEMTKLRGASDEVVAGQNAVYEKLRADVEAVDALATSFERGGQTVKEFGEQSVAMTAGLGTLDASLKSVGELKDKLLKKSEALNAAFMDGTLTFEEYRRKSAEVADELVRVKSAISDAVSVQKRAFDSLKTSVERLSDAELELEDSLYDQRDALAEVKEKLKHVNNETDEHLDLLREQKRLTDEIAASEAQLQLTRELQAKTFAQLQEFSARHAEQLARLDEQYRNGYLTLGAYNEKKAELATTTEVLNDLVGDSIDLNTRDAEATREAVNAKQEMIDANQRVAESTAQVVKEVDEAATVVVRNTDATSVLAQSQAELANQSNYAGMTTEQLRAKMAELEIQLGKTSDAGSGWWQNVKATQRDSLRFERSVVAQSLALREWEDQVASGNLTLSELDGIARGVELSLNDLDDAQLSGLIGQIESAKNELRAAKQEAEAFAASVTEALSSAQDRMYQLNDEKEASLNMQYDKEVADLEKMRQEAEAKGAQEQIGRINQAMQLTEQARQKELVAIAETRRQQQLANDEALAQQQELLNAQSQTVQAPVAPVINNDQLAALEAKIKELESAPRTVSSTGGVTTIVLQTGDQQATITGVVEEVLRVLEQAGVRV